MENTFGIKLSQQAQVTRFVQQYQLETDVATRYVDLVSEVGELGKEILESTRYGKADYQPGAGATMELGDCLFSLLALAHQMGIDSEAALAGALEKYEQRFVEKGRISSM